MNEDRPVHLELHVCYGAAKSLRLMGVRHCLARVLGWNRDDLKLIHHITREKWTELNLHHEWDFDYVYAQPPFTHKAEVELDWPLDQIIARIDWLGRFYAGKT